MDLGDILLAHQGGYDPLAASAGVAPSGTSTLGDVLEALAHRGVPGMAKIPASLSARAAHALAGVATMARGIGALPGDVARSGIQASPVTGMVSDEDIARELLAQKDIGRRKGQLLQLMIGGGPGAAEENALGIFGGKGARTADHAALARAQDMAQRGAPRESIWNQTGWFQGPDKKWRFEIPDQRSAVALKKDNLFSPLDQVLEHPELYEAYPSLARHQVDINPEAGLSSQRTGGFTPAKDPNSPGYVRVNVGGSAPSEQARDVLLHEAQHGVQELEGFSAGGNLYKVPGRRRSAAPDFDTYQRSAGEVEARNVQERKDFENRQIPPWETAGVSEDMQIVGRGRPKTSGSEQFDPANLGTNLLLGSGSRRGAAPLLVPAFTRELTGAEGYPGAVATRYPTGVSPIADPQWEYMRPDVAAMKASPGDVYGRNMRLMAGYPGMPEWLRNAPPDEIEAFLRNTMKGNLLALHDTAPEAIRQYAPFWYPGASKIAQQRASTYGLPANSVAGAYAALSPQMDWFKNLSLGDRLIDIMSNQPRAMLDPAMYDKARELAANPKLAPSFLQRLRDVDQLRGTRLQDLSPSDQALWVRLWDEAHNPRGYDVYAPTGENLGPKLTEKGKVPADVGWGSLGQIENAIRAFRSGGDVRMISADVLGDRHKVRSFYNNILYPDAPMGDVTSDTHNVAASLFRPLSGTAPEVEANLGGRGAGSDITGSRGTYGLYADALREAAAERGLPPRAMQSVTWEAIRSLFTPKQKAALGDVKMKGGGYEPGPVSQIWNKYGYENAPLARQEISNLAGGYQLPDWAVSP